MYTVLKVKCFVFSSQGTINKLASCVNKGPLLHHTPLFMTDRSSALTHFKAAITKQLSYLIAPLQDIFLTVLHLVVDVDKLNDAMLPDVVSILLGFFPVQRRPQ